jgi:two-component system, cell cycle response regulator
MNDDRTITRDIPDVTVLKRTGESARPCLIVYAGDDVGRRFDLPPGRHLIGRSPEAAVQINQPGVSRRHAELEVNGDEVTLRDLGSANRTCVNRERIEVPTRLKQGDLVQVDDVVLRFHDAASLDALLHDRIYRMATTDEGTGAYNRKYLQDTLEREVHRARRAGHPLAVICFDLDHFKHVNDTHGHAAGDQVLRECVQRVQQGLRAGDMLCRAGGEEFTVLLPDTDLPQAAVLAERLRAAVAERPFDLSGTATVAGPTAAHAQTMSLGVAELTEAMPDGGAMLGVADRRLYAAKHGGRNRVVAADG